MGKVENLNVKYKDGGSIVDLSGNTKEGLSEIIALLPSKGGETITDGLSKEIKAVTATAAHLPAEAATAMDHGTLVGARSILTAIKAAESQAPNKEKFENDIIDPLAKISGLKADEVKSLFDEWKQGQSEINQARSMDLKNQPLYNEGLEHKTEAYKKLHDAIEGSLDKSIIDNATIHDPSTPASASHPLTTPKHVSPKKKEAPCPCH